MAVIRQQQQQLVASSLILAERELKLKSHSELAPFQCESLLQTAKLFSKSEEFMIQNIQNPQKLQS